MNDLVRSVTFTGGIGGRCLRATGFGAAGPALQAGRDRLRLRSSLVQRRGDTIGLLVSYNIISGVLGKVQAEEQELGLTISNNATGPQTHEVILEANYDIHVARGVNVQPEFQYIVHPNAQASIHNAAVLGFKAHVEF